MPNSIPFSGLRRWLLPVLALALAGCDAADSTAPTEEEDLTWLQANAVPFATTSPGGGYDDLARFGQMIGDARIVGLGEANARHPRALPDEAPHPGVPGAPPGL